jgi:uncharacterized membrane protein YeaQ/YmgE (transglycosylase-associated protein family)
MLDMNFAEFFSLLIVSLIAAFIVHYGFGYRFFKHVDGFFWKWIVAWAFAWVSSPVLGHWFMRFRVDNIYLLPALLGAFVGAFCATLIWKGFSTHERALPSPHQP